jgi:hypothetical protein
MGCTSRFRQPLLARRCTSSTRTASSATTTSAEGRYGQSERVIQRLLDVERELVSVVGLGVAAQADWDHLRTPETYLGYERSEHLGEAGEFGHDADDAAVGRVTDPAVSHLLSLGIDDRGRRAVSGENGGDLLADPGRRGACWGKRHQHR